MATPVYILSGTLTTKDANGNTVVTRLFTPLQDNNNLNFSSFLNQNGDKISSVIGGAASLYGIYKNGLNIVDLNASRYENLYNSNNIQFSPAYSTDDALSLWNNSKSLRYINRGDLTRGANNDNEILSGAAAGAAAGSSFGLLGSAIGGLVGLTTGALTDVFRNKKADNKVKEVNKGILAYNNSNLQLFSNTADNTLDSQSFGVLGNYAAFGGELNTQGADFTNGILQINNGGTHELNPYEGVPMGTDLQGIPNLVEEGEVVFNDYVFSKRLKVPKKFAKEYGLGGNITFADAAKKLAKESEERPNDPISRNGLLDFMYNLTNALEEVKFKKELKANAYSYGGLVNRYDDGSWLYFGTKDATTNYDEAKYKGYSFEEFKKMFGIPDLVTVDMYNRAMLEFGQWASNPENADAYNQIVNNWWSHTPEKFRTKHANADKAALFKAYNGWDNRANYTSTSDNWSIGQLVSPSNGWENYVAVSPASNNDPNVTVASNSATAQIAKYWILGEGDADPEDITEAFLAKPDKNGRTYLDLHPELLWVNKDGIIRDPITDPETGLTTTLTDYYLKRRADTNRVNNYHVKGEDGKYHLVEGDNPYLLIMNMGNLLEVSNRLNSTGGTDYFYDPITLNDQKLKPTWMRYVPAFGAALGAATDLLGWTNRPNYSNADLLLNVARGNSGSIGYRPIGDYLTYRPLDRNYYLNLLNAQAGATRRGIMNTAGGNRGTAIAGLLGADYNTLNSVGSTLMQMDMANREHEKQVAEFNRGTNLYNSTMGLDVDKANLTARLSDRQLSLYAAAQAALMREAERLRAIQNKNLNLTNLFDSIGDIGRENFTFNLINTNPYLKYQIGNNGEVKYSSANGGYLTIKKRKYGK